MIMLIVNNRDLTPQALDPKPYMFRWAHVPSMKTWSKFDTVQLGVDSLKIKLVVGAIQMFYFCDWSQQLFKGCPSKFDSKCLVLGSPKTIVPTSPTGQHKIQFKLDGWKQGWFVGVAQVPYLFVWYQQLFKGCPSKFYSKCLVPDSPKTVRPTSPTGQHKIQFKLGGWKKGWFVGVAQMLNFLCGTNNFSKRWPSRFCWKHISPNGPKWTQPKKWTRFEKIQLGWDSLKKGWVWETIKSSIDFVLGFYFWLQCPSKFNLKFIGPNGSKYTGQKNPTGWEKIQFDVDDFAYNWMLEFTKCFAVVLGLNTFSKHVYQDLFQKIWPKITQKRFRKKMNRIG